MPVHMKINELRLRLHSSGIKKTGYNPFSKYNYFEMSDFLPDAIKIMHDLKMSALVTFSVELATMVVVDIEDGSHIQITCPMSSAALKGCHDVQNLGAVLTYMRRYLWTILLELVEHDAIDSSQPVDANDAKSAKPQRVCHEEARATGSMSESQIADWESAIREASADELPDIRKNAMQAASKARDKTSYDLFNSIAKKRASILASI